MKLLKITFIYLCINTYTYSQIISMPTLDTLYSGKYLPKDIEKSKMQIILKNLDIHCINENIRKENNLSQNRELKTMLILQNLNKKSKKTIFTDYSCLLVSYFCYNSDFVDEIYLFEFHFDTKSFADECVKSLSNIQKDETFWEYIGTKNWVILNDNNIVYFLLSRLPDDQNQTKVMIEKKIKDVLN